ncbi:MAG: hypothetical protein KatS3mg013_0501 [Actinomycetota bacterium]|nr:MAG: hypothetical protein KatS3mg013_0501 [Actinomycetota bacterium]
MIIGHLLGYLLAFPNGMERHEHLAAVGHGSFRLVGLLALAMGGVSLVALGARTLRNDSAVPLRGAALRLGWFQVPGFLLLELVERHLDLAATLADLGVLMGLLMQVVVALAIAFLLRAFVRAVQVVAALLRRGRPRGPLIRPHAPTDILRAEADLFVGTRRRAPPAPLPS